MLTIIQWGLRPKRLWSLAAATAILASGCSPSGPKAMLKGERLMSAGKYQEAAQKFEQATQLLSDSAPEDKAKAKAWDWLGVAYQNLGDSKKASEAFNHALKLDRNLSAAAYNLGGLFLEQGNYRGAMDLLNTTLQLQLPEDVKYADVYMKLASAYIRLAGQTSGAEKTRCYDSAKNYLDWVHKNAPCAEELNSSGVVLLLRYRDPRTAASRFYEAYRMDTTHTAALLNLAIVYQYYLNDPQNALAVYRAYLKAPENPQSPKPVSAKDVQAIVQVLERQTSVAPNESQGPPPVSAVKTNSLTTNSPQAAKPPVVTAKADANTAKPKPTDTTKPDTNSVKPKVTDTTKPETNSAKSKPADTAKPVEPAKSTNAPKSTASAEETKPVTQTSNAPPVQPALPPPTNSASSSNSTRTTHNPEPNQPTPTSDRYRYLESTAMAAGNRNESMRLVVQGSNVQKTNKTEAIIFFKRAISADPSCYDAYYLLGAAMCDKGDFSAALDAMERAVSLKPESADARYAFAWALSKAKYFRDCTNELDKLLKQTPGDIRAHLLLANTCAQALKEPGLAREHYERVLELDPGHPQAAAIKAYLDAPQSR